MHYDNVHFLKDGGSLRFPGIKPAKLEANDMGPPTHMW